jgi:uncharacterized membrane protein
MEIEVDMVRNFIIIYMMVAGIFFVAQNIFEINIGVNIFSKEFYIIDCIISGILVAIIKFLKSSIGDQ